MRASDREIEALAQNVVLVAALLVVVRSGPPRRLATTAGRAMPGRAAYQVLALFAPYLDGDARAYFDRLAADYL